MDNRMADILRGGVNPWECDEMGHLNTRFYVVRCTEALPVLMARAGLPGLFSAASPTGVRMDEVHIRFHREARVATSLHMTGGFAGVTAQGAEVVMLLHHSQDGTLAATFRLTLSHHDGAGRAVDWPAGFDPDGLMVEVPPQAAPRSTGTGPVQPGVGLSGHTSIGMGSVGPADCDRHGRMLPGRFAALVSDGIRLLTAPLREIVVAHSDPRPDRFGGAVLEFRLVSLADLHLGDSIEVRSAFCAADRRTMTIEHWLVDPVSGRTAGYMEAIAVVFDLDRRKIIEITEAARAAMGPLMTAPTGGTRT